MIEPNIYDIVSFFWKPASILVALCASGKYGVKRFLACYSAVVIVTMVRIEIIIESNIL